MKKVMTFLTGLSVFRWIVLILLLFHLDALILTYPFTNQILYWMKIHPNAVFTFICSISPYLKVMWNALLLPIFIRYLIPLATKWILQLHSLFLSVKVLPHIQSKKAYCLELIHRKSGRRSYLIATNDERKAGQFHYWITGAGKLAVHVVNPNDPNFDNHKDPGNVIIPKGESVQLTSEYDGRLLSLDRNANSIIF